MTELQWDEWLKTLPGRQIHWEGVVTQVQTDGTVVVDLPYEALPRAYLQGLYRVTAASLSKDQHIEFIARIKEVTDFFGIFVYLVDVTLVQR